MTQNEHIVKKAKTLGLTVRDVSELIGTEAVVLESSDSTELVINGVPVSWVNGHGRAFCDNKQLTKHLFAALNIPHPLSIAFSLLSTAESFFKAGQTYVCKPQEGSEGEGVVMNITTLEQIRNYTEKYRHLSRNLLLEEQVEGNDLRLQIVGGKIVAACIREPAYVLGDGKLTLQSLVNQRRAVMRTQNVNNLLEINQATKDLLAEQNLRLKDVPEMGRKVRLKLVSNMAQGAIAVDVSEEIHPVYQEWVSALARELKTGYFGLDILSTDYKGNPVKCSKILEINAHSDWLHHTFSDGKTHDMAGIILGHLFGKSEMV